MQKELALVVGVAQPEVQEVHPEMVEVGAVVRMKDVFQHQKENSKTVVPPLRAGTESPPTSRTPIHAEAGFPEVVLVGVGVISGLLLTVIGQDKIQIYQNGLMRTLRRLPNLVEVLIPGK